MHIVKSSGVTDGGPEAVA